MKNERGGNSAIGKMNQWKLTQQRKLKSKAKGGKPQQANWHHRTL